MGGGNSSTKEKTSTVIKNNKSKTKQTAQYPDKKQISSFHNSNYPHNQSNHLKSSFSQKQIISGANQQAERQRQEYEIQQSQMPRSQSQYYSMNERQMGYPEQYHYQNGNDNNYRPKFDQNSDISQEVQDPSPVPRQEEFDEDDEELDADFLRAIEESKKTEEAERQRRQFNEKNPPKRSQQHFREQDHNHNLMNLNQLPIGNDQEFQKILLFVIEESKKTAELQSLQKQDTNQEQAVRMVQLQQQIDNALIAKLINAEQAMNVQDEIDSYYMNDIRRSQLHNNLNRNHQSKNDISVDSIPRSHNTSFNPSNVSILADNSDFMGNPLQNNREDLIVPNKQFKKHTGIVSNNNQSQYILPIVSNQDFQERRQREQRLEQEKQELIREKQEFQRRLQLQRMEERKKFQASLEQERKRLQLQKNKELQQMERQKQESQALKLKIAELQKQLLQKDNTDKERDEARKQALDLLNQVNVLKRQNAKKKHLQALQEEKAQAMQKKMQELEDNLSFVNKDRAHIIKILSKICGRISVMCRVRNFIPHDRDNSDCVPYIYVKESFMILQQGGEKFPFDYCFNMQTSQLDVFERTKYLVSGALEGNNTCILAYGQTGSGKTFTMEGTDQQPGITRNFLSHMYEDLKVKQNTMKKKLITKCQLIELYCDQINCLLSDQKNLKYVTSGDYVSGAEERVVTSLQGALDLYNKYVKKRRVSSHSWNKESSRSHLIFTVSLFSAESDGSEKLYSKMCFVDLAGSERLKKTQTQGKAREESIKINVSLTALCNVLKQLKNNNSSPSFRDNKLTLLLQGSMGGKSQTLMFVNVSPKQEDFEQTMSSCRTGKNARTVIAKKKQ